MKRGGLQVFADALLGISLDSQSLPDRNRVGAVISILKEAYSGVYLKNLLVAYLRAMERFIRKNTLKIEYCGNLPKSSVEAIGAHFEKSLGRKLMISAERADSLIAGIRVSVGDMVIENTIACTLDAYKKHLCAA